MLSQRVSVPSNSTCSLLEYRKVIALLTLYPATLLQWLISYRTLFILFFKSLFIYFYREGKGREGEKH